MIELMIALAVAGVLMALAAPSFQQSMAGNRLSTAASELAGAVQLARSEAVRANRRVSLCRSSDGSACSGISTSWPGWIVFVDTDGDGVRGANEPVVKSGTFDGPVQMLSSSNVTALGESITFRGDGIARAANGQTLLTATLAVCMPTLQPTENVREVNIAFGSRTALRRRNASGVCATPDNS
jgi:type IV fimbrial biogenesis protein FimT